MQRWAHSYWAFLAAVVVLTIGPSQAAAVDITGTYITSTTLNDTDNWSGGTVTISGATTVVDIPTGATVTFDAAANRTMNGDGIFRVQSGGTFVHDGTNTSGDNIDLNGSGVTFDNLGTFEFANGGDVRLYGSNVLNNSGLLLKSGATGTAGDPTYIFGGGASNFVNSGTIQVDAGHLNLAQGMSTGGNFITNGTGTLTFSGSWSEITGVSTVNGGAIRFSNDNPAGTTGGHFTAAAAVTTLNVTGDGILWDNSTLNTNGNVIENDGILVITNGGTKTANGGGTLRNAGGGTVNWQGTGNSTVTLTGVNFVNQGTLNLTTTHTKTLAGSGSLINEGIIDWDAGTLEVTGGPVENEGTLNLSGTSSKTLSGSGTFHNAATGTMNWLGGTFTLNNDLINDGTFEYSNSTTNTNLGGAGSFINNGTFIHSAGGGGDNIVGSSSGTFVNNGLFNFTNIGDFELTDNYTFENIGTLRKSAGTESLIFHFGSGTAGTLDNQGIIEVLTGELEIRSSATSGFADIVVTQYDSGTKTLTGGTWAIRSTSSTSRLDLQPANAGIETIGAGATVELTGTNSFFDQLTGDLTTVAGTLTINNRTFAASDFGAGPISLDGGTFDGSGTITLGDALNVSGASTIGVGTLNLGGAMTISSSLDWQGGTINLGANNIQNNDTINLTTGTTKTLSGTGTLINPTGSTIDWQAGSLTLNADIQNEGTFQFTGSTNRYLGGSGTITNDGTFVMAASSAGDNIETSGTNGQFINNGLFHIQTEADFALEQNYTLTNAAGAVFRKTSTGGAGAPSLIFSRNSVTGAGLFDNQGTVEVLSGELEFRGVSTGFEDVGIQQWDSGTNSLTGGTWIIRDPDGAGGGSATLDMQPANAGIVNLGATATVELTGPQANFSQLTGYLTNVAGALEVNDRTFTIPGGGTLTLDGGTLAGDEGVFGGTTVAQTGATITPGSDLGSQVGTITIDGDLEMQAGSTLSLDINGPADFDQVLFANGGTFTLDNATLDVDLGYALANGDTFVIVSGFDTLAGAGIFDGLGQGDPIAPGAYLHIVYGADSILLTAVPEPGTWMLLLSALACLLIFRRRLRGR